LSSLARARTRPPCGGAASAARRASFGDNGAACALKKKGGLPLGWRARDRRPDRHARWGASITDLATTQTINAYSYYCIGSCFRKEHQRALASLADLREDEHGLARLGLSHDLHLHDRHWNRCLRES
jgi:hypothetical protein